MFRSEHSSTIIAARLAGLVVVISTALSVLLSACSDLPTDARATPTETPHAALASDAITANAIAGVSDALDRIVPTLTRPAAEPLRAALESLRGRLADDGRDAAAIRDAVTAAKDAVCAYSQAVGYEPGSAADLDALRLTLGALTACTGSPLSAAGRVLRW